MAVLASTVLSINPELCRRVDFAQDREPVERPVKPQFSPTIFRLTRNDSFVELPNSQPLEGRGLFSGLRKDVRLYPSTAVACYGGWMGGKWNFLSLAGSSVSCGDVVLIRRRMAF